MERQQLIVVGDLELVIRLKRVLKRFGFSVVSRDWAWQWSEEEKKNSSLVIVVVDRVSDQVSQFCQRFVRECSSAPLMVVSTQAGVATRLESLDSGAYDWLEWTGDALEVLARIKSLQRRWVHHQSLVRVDQVTKLGRGHLTAEGFVVGDRRIALTPQEHVLLRLLGRVPRQVVPQTTLAHHLQPGYTPRPANDHLRSALSRLRRKLKLLAPTAEIQAVYRYGYRFLPP
jgi:DNA-binding response OmpR family regulator